MSVIKSGVKNHDDACFAAEATRQTAIAAAGNSQVLATAAEIAHYRACLASAIANKCGIEPFVVALRSLGVNG